MANEISDAESTYERASFKDPIKYINVYLTVIYASLRSGPPGRHPAAQYNVSNVMVSNIIVPLDNLY